MTEILKMGASRRNESGRENVSSGQKSADALIHTGGGIVSSGGGIDDAANACAFALHDSLDNSGPIIAEFQTDGDGKLKGWGEIDGRFNTGLYVDITTSGTVTYEVLYRAD